MYLDCEHNYLIALVNHNIAFLLTYSKGLVQYHNSIFLVIISNNL